MKIPMVHTISIASNRQILAVPLDRKAIEENFIEFYSDR